MKNISKTTKTILFASLIAAMILPYSLVGVADAAKAPDLTDYVSQYRDIEKTIRENQKLIESDQKTLNDNSELSDVESATIEKRTIDKKVCNACYL